MTTHRVIVTREGAAWLADAVNLEGTHTWARNLPALDRAVREAIALAEDLREGAENSLEIEYTYHTGDPDLDAQAEAVRAEREHMLEAERALLARTRALAMQIVEKRGLSVRDAARLLNISPQRISQITAQRTTNRSAHVAPRRRRGGGQAGPGSA